MLTDAAMRDIRSFFQERFDHAQYQVSNTWYDVPLSEVEITDDGIVRVKYTIAHGAACTITGVRLISVDGDIWAEKAISVVIDNAQTNHLQWFDFEIVEEEVS